MSKHLLGLLACVAAVAIGVGITYYFDPPAPEPPPAPAPPPQPETPPPPPPSTSDAEVEVSVRQLTLDRAAKRSVATVDLSVEGGEPPDRVWIWTVFFVPGGEQLSADPVEVRWPRGAGRQARVEVATPAPWVFRPGDPGSGYYARVYASALSARDARRTGDEVDTSLRGAVPVLVVEGPRTKL